MYIYMYVELMAGIAVGGHDIRCFFTLQSNFSSAGFIRLSKLTLCEYPARCSLRRNRSTCSLSAALAQPQHAGPAFSKQCIVLQPICPQDAERIRRLEEAHLLMMLSTYDVTVHPSRALVNQQIAITISCRLNTAPIKVYVAYCNSGLTMARMLPDMLIIDCINGV